MSFVIVEDVAFDPVSIGLFGAVGTWFEANVVSELVKESPPSEEMGSCSRGLLLFSCPFFTVTV